MKLRQSLMENKVFKGEESDTEISFAKFCLELSENLIGTGNNDQSLLIQSCLAKIKEYLHVDEVFLLRYTVLSNNIHLHLTVPDKSLTVFAGENDYPDDFPYFAKIFKKREVLKLDRINSLPEEAQKEAQFLNQKGVASLLSVPITTLSKELFYFGAISVNERLWIDAEVERMRVLSNIVNCYLEHIEANKQILILENKFRTVADNTADMELWYSEVDTLTYISPSCEKITGYSRDEIVCNPSILDEIVLPEDKVKWKLIVTQLNQTEIIPTTSFRITRKDGKIRWIEAALKKVLDPGGNFAGYRSSCRDITEHKETEEQFHINEVLYRSILEGQTDLICRYTPTGILTFMNSAYEQFFNIRSAEWLGRNLVDLVPEDEHELFRRVLELANDTKQIIREERSIVMPDGSTRWTQWVNKGIYFESSNHTEIQSVGRDITSLKETLVSLEGAFDKIKLLKQQLEEENISLKESYFLKSTHSGMVSRNPGIQKVWEQATLVAKTSTPVLICGETGTGKELIARSIHAQSKRNKKVLVTVNCATLPASLIESELFGREKGSYTGALSRQIGRFEMANGSSIFLDEIGELPIEVQSKLLRILQSGEFEMLGNPQTKKVDVRIIAATNKDLSKAVEEGNFRKDLFYRLNVFPINMLPLRERTEDIPLLVWDFIKEFSDSMGKKIESISKKSMEKLMNYPWHGNIRELRNIVEYSMILATGKILNIEFHDEQVNSNLTTKTLEDVERAHIIKILDQTSWRLRGKDGAAELLGLNESTLRFRMKKLGIERQ